MTYNNNLKVRKVTETNEIQVTGLPKDPQISYLLMRNYWDAPEVYNTMSPFMNAEKMKTPLLLIHGDADNNTGTYTMQTERYFQALKGLGAPVRMVLLPKEAHGYAAKENILHVLWEQDQFLEKYLK